VAVRPLRGDGEQTVVARTRFVDHVRSLLG
jgi:hypothetical protein